MKNSRDLDTSIGPDWERDHPVYCPVPWCAAHKLRTAPCGDDDGEYVGVHVARVEYVPKFLENEQKRVEFFRSHGSKDPELDAAVTRVRQDSIDMGMVPGRHGRRRV